MDSGVAIRPDLANMIRELFGHVVADAFRAQTGKQGNRCQT